MGLRLAALRAADVDRLIEDLDKAFAKYRAAYQFDSVDEETLLLFTSKADKACLRDRICLIPIVLWGKLKDKVMIQVALHRISSK